MRWSPDREATEVWLTKVKDVDLWDDEAFHTIVRLGLELARMTDAAFAELVNMSRPSVTRWRQGQSVPHSGIRLTIYKILKKEVEKAELRSLCKAWLDAEDDEGFATIVVAYLDMWLDGLRVLADEFEAAPATVTRWAKGTSRPRPRMKRGVVEWVYRKAGQ